MINQSFSMGKVSMFQSPCLERIEFVLAYYQRWIYDHQQRLKNDMYGMSMKELFDNLQ
eukprot:CAMPEP_0197069452 /NCGR_PEP_ID=MMETSP1384-20130603/193242_1 /TAXON_ID=29189 /ORGANISM="Ammonia sp." /LENGTH=57 /DNA_ID=CAMNT_0042507511 /DNA_START=14 /DNA_END=184 /DNA_ORIENTATION=+